MTSETKLVTQIAYGDEKESKEAWECLMRMHGRLIEHLGRAAHYSNPSDLKTELYLHLRGVNGEWNRLKSYQPRAGVGFENWLAIVAGRLARQKAADGSKESALKITLDEEQADTIGINVEPPMFQEERRVVVLKAIQKLKHPHCRILLCRHYWNEEDLCEIAGELGLKPDNVRQIHRRNLQELHRVLGHPV
ncbi:MAG: sigma-70 family RNA polymerase sigma factor [bacterium]